LSWWSRLATILASGVECCGDGIHVPRLEERVQGLLRRNDGVMGDERTMLIPLPGEDAWLRFGEAEYLIPVNWEGERNIVSECGWWIGTICIVAIDGARFIDWLEAYSLKLDGE
jgi:hypothetical protein